MLLKWLEPQIDKRSWEVVQICEQENASLYNQLSEALKVLKSAVPESEMDRVVFLEELFYERSDDIRKAYKIGFEEAVRMLQVR